MDVCWLDTSNDTLWMVELKAFDHAENIYYKKVDISQNEVADYWINELFLKSLHTLTMLETNRSGTSQCLVNGLRNETSFKIVHLINVIYGQEEYLSFWKDKLEDKLKPYMKIYNVSSLSVLPYKMAKEKGWLSWIV